VVDSAGVTLVAGPGEDRPLGWTLEKAFEIQPLEDEGDGFFGVREVEVLDGDRIAVLDPDAKRVVVFDEDGRFLMQYGREGSGPGEFQFPFEMVAAPGGGVSVYDVMNARLERFDSTLTPGASDPLQVGYFGGHLDYVGPYMVVPTQDLTNTEDHIQTIVALGAADTIEVARFQREVGGAVTLESCGMQLSGMPRLFEAQLLWAAGPDGTLLVVGTDRYEVDMYRSPRFSLERRIRRAVPAIGATAQLAEESVGDGMRVMTPAGERVCDAGEVVEQRGFAPEVPPIAAIAVAPSGEIYVQRWALEAEDRAIDVLAPDGEYLGTLAPGFPFPDAFLGKDRIVVRAEDELGLTSVVVYRVQR